MFAGLLGGSLSLIVLYAIGQKGASDRSSEAVKALSDGLKRLLSPQVAGIADHAHATGGARLPAATTPAGPATITTALSPPASSSGPSTSSPSSSRPGTSRTPSTATATTGTGQYFV